MRLVMIKQTSHSAKILTTLGALFFFTLSFSILQNIFDFVHIRLPKKYLILVFV